VGRLTRLRSPAVRSPPRDIKRREEKNRSCIMVMV
jgi:hypothetical protein